MMTRQTFARGSAGSILPRVAPPLDTYRESVEEDLSFDSSSGEAATMRTPWTILMVISSLLCATVVVSKDYDCLEKACGATFSCPKVRSCNCSSFGDYYELSCHSDLIVFTVRPFKSLRIECRENASPSVFESLEGLIVGPANEVYLELCPLPETWLSQLLRSLGVTSVNAFQFHSGRNIPEFDKRHLTGLGDVTELVLTSEISRFSKDFLAEFPKLTWLDLKENKIENLEENFFFPVSDLEVLELGGNKLKQVKAPLLSNLKKLRLLNLWKNVLRNLTRSAFSGLSALEQLDLSSNAMNSLPSDLFHDLTALAQLNLSSNNFTGLPEGILSGNVELELIRLHDNRQKLLLGNGIFANLKKLKEVHLMRNNIVSVPENLFWGSDAITSIDLKGNALALLPPRLFEDQQSLRILDLSENRIENLPESLFKHLSKLHTLDLSRNKIKRISRQVFSELYNLVILNVEHNELSFIDSESLIHMEKLKTAQFSRNKLSFLPERRNSEPGFPYWDELGSRSPFRNCVSLEELDLSHNSIADVFSDWQFNLIKLRNLNLSYNKIERIHTSSIHFLSEKIVVDLRRNEITGIVLEGLENLALSQNAEEDGSQEKKVRILLEQNPLNCNCHAYELFRYLEHKLDPKVYLLVTLVPGDLKCKFPAKFSGLRVEEVKSSELTCPLDSSYDCPKSCNCILRRHDWGLVVNCTRSGLTEIPGILPRVAGTNHTVLLLDGNRIGRLPNSTYPGYENVTHLHLSSNAISDVGPGMLSHKLQVLTLDDNNLTSLGSGIVRFLSDSRGIRLLTLHNNPWKCDCSARELLDLIQQKFKEIPHLSNVTCFRGNEPLAKMSVSDLCPASAAVVVSCIVAAVFGLLVGTLAILYYRYQREVKVWLYGHRLCLWLVTEEELDRDKLYDAFVSYSHKDESFVVNTLVPELESGDNPFKLCLHYRDWIAGEWIPNQIARSVENSRRTLVVLSPNFLESVWSRMEFRAAHKQALSEGRARVIVVLYGDVGPTEDLDPELRAYISMNTYVKWGDPWFWGKLRYALPHPPSVVNTKNLNFMRRRTMKKEKAHLDDKLELIHRLDTSCLPPGGTTPPTDATSAVNVTPNKQLT